MPLVRINTRPTLRDCRIFGAVVIPVLVGLLSAWLLWRDQTAVGAGLLLIAAVSLGTALARPAWFRFPFVAWMTLTFPLGWHDHRPADDRERYFRQW